LRSRCALTSNPSFVLIGPCPLPAHAGSGQEARRHAVRRQSRNRNSRQRPAARTSGRYCPAAVMRPSSCASVSAAWNAYVLWLGCARGRRWPSSIGNSISPARPAMRLGFLRRSVRSRRVRTESIRRSSDRAAGVAAAAVHDMGAVKADRTRRHYEMPSPALTPRSVEIRRSGGSSEFAMQSCAAATRGRALPSHPGCCL
jgi:hypothetical protein